MRFWSILLALALLAGCQHKYAPPPDENGAGGAGRRDGGAGAGCVGLQCQVNQSCRNGAHTTLKGRVFAPNGILPLYNAAVFVPRTTVEPFPDGVTCNRCDGKLSGAPIAAALTGPDGSFTLVDVPGGKDIPLVIQIGRWRRQVIIPGIDDCRDNTLLDTELTRLPRNATEGDIPRIAIASGRADPFECLLLKIGMDAREITAPDDAFTGRIHYYLATDAPGPPLAGVTPRADRLFATLPNLLRYDVVILPCEGGRFDKSAVDTMTVTPDPRVLLGQYLDAGGRVFATHLSYDWFTYARSPFNKIAAPTNGEGQWPVGQADDYGNTIHVPLNATFPKGADFSSWLLFAGAHSAPGTLDINEGRHDLTGVDPTLAQPWAIYDFSGVGSGPGVMHFTFNTPLSPPKDDQGVPLYCGRVVFSDFHVSAGVRQSLDLPFPVACKAEPMTDQEKALAFMLFDLSSCVQEDSIVPVL